MLVTGKDWSTRELGFVSIFFVGAVGVLALLGILRRRNDGAKQENSQAMTRDRMLASIEHMNGVIHCMSPFYFDIRGPATPSEILIDEWVADKKAEWFSVFLEIVAHPPPEADDLWQYSVAQLMQAWVLHYPNRFFPQIGEALPKEGIGPVMLEALAGLATPRILTSPERREQFLGWLLPLIDQALNLTNQDQERLIEAVGEAGGPLCRPLLEQLEAALANGSEEVCELVRQYLKVEAERHDASL